MKHSQERAVWHIPAFVLALGVGAYAQSPVLITQPINESNLLTLAGNTRPEASAANDRGRVDDSVQIDHMLLQLQRSPEVEQGVDALINQLHDPGSPNYHRWLAASQVGQRFGLALQDLSKITNWLESQGFKVDVIYPNGLLIDFSGTAGQIRAAFHTEIHDLMVDGTPHIANMSDPKIPTALAPAISGIVSLHNFWPHPMYKSRANFTIPIDGFTLYEVSPPDLAEIYNLAPLLASGTTGKGQTVAVVEDSNLFAEADWTDFRNVFGLNRWTFGQLKTVHPPSSGKNNCLNPGVNGDSVEATIDAEYASAAAPNATIEVATCDDTKTTFGGLIAIQNLLNASATPPSIISVSYGECEAFTGAAANSAFNKTYQQAVMEGVSVFVSSGDDAAAGCDRNGQFALHGIGVTGWGDTPYNVAVGGTDFADTFQGTNATYWNRGNSSIFKSAKSYIPEIPWNDTCASVLIALALGFPQTYGNAGACNSATGQGFLGTTGGSGGPSGCATGVPATAGVVNGTCKGYAKPSWQSGVIGIPKDGVRDIPDVSLFAANGVWNHFYPVCFSGFTPCSAPPADWPGFGGTSFSSPIMAGIQALVNQGNGPQGNPNFVYYKLAAKEYGPTGSSACNSTLGNSAASTCTFYDVTLGDMDVPCVIGVGSECFKPSGIIGVLSTSGTSFRPAYGTTVGWDFATGIGTVNAANLVRNWTTVAP